MCVNINRPQSELKIGIHYVFALLKSQIMQENQHMISLEEGMGDVSQFMMIVQ